MVRAGEGAKWIVCIRGQTTFLWIIETPGVCLIGRTRKAATIDGT